MKNVLLTWWLGFIGSHVASLLLEKQDHNVVIVDNLSNSQRDVLKQLKTISWNDCIFYEWDISDTWLMKKAFHAHAIDLVIHFAAFKSVGESCHTPFVYYENNIQGTLHLLQAMRESSVDNIIFSSSATVYDSCKNMPPFTEEWVMWWTSNPYWTTKLIIECILRDLVLHAWLNAISLRYFNPIWAHPSWLIGESITWHPTNLLPIIMQHLMWIRPSLTVYWNDYDTHDGTCIRDYIHVMDLASWHIAAMQYLFKTSDRHQSNYSVFNLGTWTGTSVLDLISEVETALWKTIEYSIWERRSWDVAVAYANVDKANKILNRQAEYTTAQAITHARAYSNKAI